MRYLLMLAVLFPLCVGAQSYAIATGSHTFTRLSAPSLLALTDNELSAAINPSGFSFEYFGSTYTEFKIGSNGYLIMGSAGTTSGQTPFPSWAPGLTISPLWRDLNPPAADPGDGIGWEFANGVLTVEWDEVPCLWPGGWQLIWTYANMQAVLDTNTGTVEFRYGTSQKPQSGPPTPDANWFCVHIAGPSGAGQEIINGSFGPYISNDGELVSYPANKFIRFEPLVAPALSGTPVTEAWVGQAYSYSFNVTGSPAPNLSVTGLPAWLSLSGETLIGTPGVGDVGQSTPITIQASSPLGTDTQQFSILVHDTNPANGGSGSGDSGGGCAASQAAGWWCVALVVALFGLRFRQICAAFRKRSAARSLAD